MLLLLLGVLAQTPQPTAWVALARRQGIAATTANERLAELEAQLAAARVPLAAAGDVTSCQRKLACIVKAARARGAQWVVIVEVARVLEQEIVKLDVVSVEEDGRRLASAIYDGPAAQAREGMAEQVKAKVLPALAPLIPAAPPPAAPPPAPAPAPEEKPDPVVIAPATPAPQPVPAPVIVTEPPPPPKHGFDLRVPGFIAAALGVGGLGTAVALGVLTLQQSSVYSERCGMLAQCNDTAALRAYDRAATFQDAGLAAAVTGAALLAAGLVLIFLGRSG